MLKAFAAALALAALLAPLPSPADELAERAAIKDEVTALLRSKNFAQLEKLASSYRTEKTRTRSGVWKLSVFYAGVGAFFDRKRKDEEYWTGVEPVLQRWIDAYPSSPSARIAYAQMLMTRAWNYRGGGYAHTVRPQDWQPFREYVQRARASLETHKALASADPKWYDLMAFVATSQGWPAEEFSKLLEEALQREPLYYETYFSAIDYYLPKWHGSVAAIEQFARESMERTRTSEGRGLYARIYWYASQTEFQERIFSASLVDWELMKNGIDDVLKQFPDAWNINNFAKFACLSRDRPKTAELIARIEGEPLLAAWNHLANFERCKAWASGAL